MTSVTHWVGTTTNRLYPRFTYDAAGELVDAEPTGDLSDLAGRRYCALVSFKRDGSGVSTPVWFALRDGKVLFRSLAESYKLRRIRNRPEVLVAPCSRRGKPTGPPLIGTARILERNEEAAAEEALQGNFGMIRAGYEAAIRDAAARYVEVTPKAAEAQC